LLVMDGMGFQQWSVIRDKLLTCSNLVIDEHYCFAWVPTITSISRQALFSGKRPQLFADSLLSTSKEEALWRAYWEDKGLQRNQVLFKKKIENIKVREEFVDLFYPPSLKVAGLVVNFIDEQMHGMVAGMAGLNAVVQVWLDDWQFTDKIASILDAGFEIVITADHGNQEGVGCGWPNEGVKAETKGERVRMYKSSESASSSAEISDDEVVE
ncbi:PglZ domain-containing protein, partial [Pseudomonas saponiphila]